MNIFLTSDSHFGHGNIIKYCNRPWMKPTDLDADGEWVSEEVKRERTRENDETLIANWNSRVQRGDIVYHLGDFAFTKTPADTEAYIRRLNGSIHLIRGNHDKDAVAKAKGFAWVSGEYQGKMVAVDSQDIFCFHTACLIWPKSHRGCWHLHGHSHGTLPDNPNSLSIDVGVDANNFYPLEFHEVKAIMARKTFVPIDSHGNR